MFAGRGKEQLFWDSWGGGLRSGKSASEWWMRLSVLSESTRGVHSVGSGIGLQWHSLPPPYQRVHHGFLFRQWNGNTLIYSECPFWLLKFLDFLHMDFHEVYIFRLRKVVSYSYGVICDKINWNSDHLMRYIKMTRGKKHWEHLINVISYFCGSNVILNTNSIESEYEDLLVNIYKSI